MLRSSRYSFAFVLFLMLSGCNCGDVEPEEQEVSASRSLIEAESPVSVRGNDSSEVTVTVLDEEGLPIQGVEVELSSSRGGHDILIQPPTSTDEQGIARGGIESTVEGITTISATANGVELDATAEVEFIDEEACPDGQIYCGEETGCVVLGSLEHCSTCHDECTAPENAEPYCNGSCGWACIDGFASCDEDDETGCETELGTLDNCLACGDECLVAPNSTSECEPEGCTFTCDAGWGSCDGDLSTGCETELEDGECPARECPDGEVDCGTAGCVELGTVDHCLDCHDECIAPANADPVCLPGGCSFECHVGFGNCDGDPATGCEAELTDEGACPSGCPPGQADCGDGCVPLDTIDNCGDCGVTCAAPANAEAVCLPEGCSYVCLPGFGDCDGDPSSGCEQSLDSDLLCGACDAACEDPPNAVGFCEDGDTGSCGYTCLDGFEDCDGNPETGCETDLSVGTCCDFESFVSLGSTCLVAGVEGLAVVHIEVRDIDGQLVSGADVALETGDVQVLDSVEESTAQPGVYWAIIEAPDLTGDYEISAAATYDGDWVCGAQVSMAPVTLSVVPPSAHHNGGTGGCIPRGGNLRVRAVDELGEPISGAFVMVGDAVDEQAFFSDYESFLAGEDGDVSNESLTDEDGYALFTDLGDVLDDPSLMITAGAEGRAYGSVVGFDTSDVVLMLESLPPPPDRVLITGTVTPPYHVNETGEIAMSLAMESLDITALSSFNFMNVLEANKLVDVSGNLCLADGEQLAIPGNIHFPDQFHLGCDLRAAPADWQLTPLRGDFMDVPVLQGELNLIDAISIGDDEVALISAISFQQVGIGLDIPTDENQPNVELELSADLVPTMPVQAVNAPQGELWLLSIGDLDAENGTGRLFLQGVEVQSPASSLSGTLTTSEPDGYFAGIDHLAMALTMVVGEGTSAVLDRATTGRTSARLFDDFFSTPGAAATNNRVFSWPDVANSNSPSDYHVAKSILHRFTPPPSGAWRSEEEPFWVVYSPGGVRSFQLPTLPAHAPRASDQGYLIPEGTQRNHWFLGLFYMGVHPDEASLQAGDIDFSAIEGDLTHISMTTRRL